LSDARNRDDSLERLLRKAKPMLGGTATPEACLDAEMVAAWAAGGLSRDELERAQEHTAGCTRCQALVALVVRIDPATAVDEMPAPRSRAWIGWFVPLAAAAGLVLFLMTRPPGPLPAPAPSALPLAPAATSAGAGQEVAVTPPAPRPVTPAEAPLADTAPAADPSTVGAVSPRAPAGAAPAAADDARRRQGTTGQLADAAAAKPGAGATAEQSRNATFRAAENRAMPMAQGQGQAGPVGGMTGSAAGGIAAPPPPPPAVAIAPPPPAATPAPIPTMRESVTLATPPPAPPAPASPAQQAAFAGAGRGGRGGGRGGGGGGVAGGAANAAVAMDAVGSPRVVVVTSPNSSVRWRATGALVERSTDGGATWQFVARVVEADFRAASSPSPLVCWLVGREGKVVVFTEGRTARAVTFPEMIDLTMVRATDDQIATVTAAGGREYTTINGGLSWNVR
jgi:hypothetical protein